MIDQHIFRQEIQHLKRFRHLWIYLLLLPAFSVLIPIISGISNVPTPYYNNRIPDPMLIVVLISAHLFYIFVILRTGVVAVHSINREFETGAWEILRISGTSPARIAWSKWAAVMRYVWRDHLIAVVPRFAFLVMFSVAS